MEPLHYLHLQMSLEGLALDSNNLITQADPTRDEPPLVLLARMADGLQIVYVWAALPAALRQKLVDDAARIACMDTAALIDRLRSHGIPCKTSHYKTFIFPQRYADIQYEDVKCLHKDEPRVRAFGFGGLVEFVYGIAHNGKLVSACVSARQDDRSAEAWVFTTPEHRGLGLGQRVVAAWARAQVDAARVPFYSHDAGNHASARLATALALTPVFEEITVEIEG